MPVVDLSVYLLITQDLSSCLRFCFTARAITDKKDFWRASVRCHSFAYVAHFVFLRDAWIQTQRDAVASKRATNLATNLPKAWE